MNPIFLVARRWVILVTIVLLLAGCGQIWDRLQSDLGLKSLELIETKVPRLANSKVQSEEPMESPDPKIPSSKENISEPVSESRQVKSDLEKNAPLAKRRQPTTDKHLSERQFPTSDQTRAKSVNSKSISSEKMEVQLPAATPVAPTASHQPPSSQLSSHNLASEKKKSSDPTPSMPHAHLPQMKRATPIFDAEGNRLEVAPNYGAGRATIVD